MDIARLTRLKQLHALDEKVSSAILGHPVQDRHELNRLQKRVRDEIRAIVKEIKEAKIRLAEGSDLV